MKTGCKAPDITINFPFHYGRHDPSERDGATYMENDNTKGCDNNTARKILPGVNSTNLFPYCMGLLRFPTIPSKPSTGWIKDNTDYYKVLGVPQTASQNDIKKAYRLQLKRWHPDKNPDNKKEAEEKSKEIMAAYKLLSNKNKCDLYDCSLKDRQKETDRFPFYGDGKIRTTEKEPPAKADKLNSKDGKLNPEKSNESFSSYEESTFESYDELYSEDSHSSEELFGQAREFISESSSKSKNLNSDSDFESRETSPVSYKSLQSCMYSKSHKSNQKSTLSPRKKDLPDKMRRPQDGRNGLPAMTPEQHSKSKSIKKPFPENIESYTWNSETKSEKNKLCPGKNKQYEINTEGRKLPRLKTEPCSRKDKLYSGKKKTHNGKSEIHTKNGLLKEKADGHIGKHKMQIKKSLTVKNRTNPRFEYTKGPSHNAEQKELLDGSTSGIRYFRYTRRKVSPSVRQDTQPGNSEQQFQMSELQVGNSRTYFQKRKLQSKRNQLHTGKCNKDVQMRELLFRENKINVQTKDLHKERGSKEVRELHDGKSKIRVSLCNGNKSSLQYKELMAETNEPDYSWKIPATICFAPEENAAKWFFGETTSFSDDQAPPQSKKRPRGATQTLNGNQKANIQAWDKIYQLHNRKNLLLHINIQPQKGKDCSSYDLNNQILSNVQAEILSSPALRPCSRCSQCWFKWFFNDL